VWYFLFYHTTFLVDLLENDSIPLRLGLAIKCIFTCSLILVVIIPVMTTKRFLSETINPTLMDQVDDKGSISAEVKAKFNNIQLYQRILQNSLEQFTIVSCNILVLSLYLERTSLRLLVFTSVTFLLCRSLFWYGYLKNYILRSYGFIPGIILNMTITMLSLYYIITADVIPYMQREHLIIHK